MRDPYESLAVPRSATADDIKKSFRLLAKRLHPDANNNDPKAVALFAELSAAYAILGNEEKRDAFDRGEIDARGKPTRQGIGPAMPDTWHIVTSLMVVMVMLAATSTLIMRGLVPDEKINANSEVSSRWVADEEHTGAAQTADLKGLSEPRLILLPNDFYAADGTVPLGIQVSGKAVDLAVEISGLPRGMRISSGRALGAGWRILAKDLDNAMIHPPPGFSGAIDLAVELRLVDDTVVDHALFRLEWPTPTVAPVPIESAGDIAGSETTANKVTVTAALTDQNAIDRAAQSQLDHQQIELFLGRSQQLISEGDVGAARTLLQPPGKARHARAALARGATYDPIMLAILQARGIATDVSLAPDWYKKGREFGSREVQQQLNFLTAALIPLEPVRGTTVSDNAPKVMPTPAAKPKRHVVRAPTHLHGRPHDRYGVYVAGADVVADPDPLRLPPAFIQ